MLFEFKFSDPDECPYFIGRTEIGKCRLHGDKGKIAFLNKKEKKMVSTSTASVDLRAKLLTGSFLNQHIISPYSISAESFIQVMRIKEMTSNLRSFDC